MKVAQIAPLMRKKIKMKGSNVKRTLLFLLFLLFLKNIFAEKIVFSSDKMTGLASHDSVESILSGNAFIKTEHIKIESNVIELSGKDFRKITARENVKGENEKDKFSFSADIFKYDREKKVSEFFGNIRFVDATNDAIVMGDYAMYDEKTEVLTVKFNVRINQKDKKCKSLFARYDRKTSFLDLLGKPEVQNKDNTFRAARISINLENDEIKMQGKISGQIVEREKNAKQ